MPFEAPEDQDDQSLRLYLKSKEIERGMSVDPKPDLPSFAHWNDVPSSLKCAGQWMRVGRKVIAEELPAGKVAVAQDGGVDDPVVVDGGGDWEEAPSHHALLYRLEQTRPYTPNPRTMAYWGYDDVFLKGANRRDWILKAIDDGTEAPEWMTSRANGISGNFHDYRMLSSSQIRSHLNHKQVAGIKNGSGKTRFVAIDLDFHGRDKSVFLDQAKALLKLFHGDTWHYQIADGAINGIHLIHVFSVPRDLTESITHLRRQLRRLDQQFPELRERAEKAGMRTIADLELYPAKNQGFRLPLAFGRVVVLDKILPAIEHKGKKVADVESYVRWLDDPGRQHMPADKILELLEQNTTESAASSQSTTPIKKQRHQAVAGDILCKWKGNQRKAFHDFWKHGEANGKSLNEHIAVVARTSWAMGYEADHTIYRLKKMVRELPEQAQSASQRLLKSEYGKIDKVIRSTVRTIFAGNSNQKNGAKSTKILKDVAEHYKKIGFDPLEPQTWVECQEKASVLKFCWTPDLDSEITSSLKTVLNVKSEAEIVKFVEGVIALAQRMEGRQWGHQYFYTWCQSEHPSVRLGFRTKRFLVLEALQKAGILELKSKGNKRHGCSEWSLGAVAISLINPAKHQLTHNEPQSEEDLGQGRLLQGVKARPSTTFQSSVRSSSLGKAAEDRGPCSSIYTLCITSIYIGFYFESFPLRNPVFQAFVTTGLDPPFQV